MIGAVVLLFFGAKRMPDLFRSVGKSIREFKNAKSGIEQYILGRLFLKPLFESSQK